MGQLDGRVAWVTGAGSGIGAAAATALAAHGATVVLTGRTRSKLEHVAAGLGHGARVEVGDVANAEQVEGIVARIATDLGRLDILVANAGVNIANRDWATLTPDGVAELIQGNLASAFYCASAVLPIMRAQHEGLLIMTASIAGRVVSALSGPGYTAAKHGVVAMSHSINIEECVNGIRATAVLPGEVATPLLDKRPTPVSAEDRARMLQPEDLGNLIGYIACLPGRVVINEVMICPTWNRAYVGAPGVGSPEVPDGPA
jgi:NADP-dependent 3-hydroxy acid dehydrogenase YdfG